MICSFCKEEIGQKEKTHILRTCTFLKQKGRTIKLKRRNNKDKNPINRDDMKNIITIARSAIELNLPIEKTKFYEKKLV